MRYRDLAAPPPYMVSNRIMGLRRNSLQSIREKGVIGKVFILLYLGLLFYPTEPGSPDFLCRPVGPGDFVRISAPVPRCDWSGDSGYEWE